LAGAAIPDDGIETKVSIVAAKPPAARPRIARRDSGTAMLPFSSLCNSSPITLGTDGNEREVILVVFVGTTNALTPPSK
jgi:hypothetical protein